MKIIDSFLSYLKMAYMYLCIFITAFLCGIDPKNELKYRKKCAKKIVDLITKKVIIKGRLDKSAQLLIGNHTHDFDVALMETAIPEKVISIAKKELSEIPVVKYLVTKTDMILVDRANKHSILKTIRDVKERIDKGLKIIVYPEGTRNKVHPKKMLKWKNGVKGMAEKLNLKVQPFVIINLPFIFKKHPFRIEKQTIKIIFLKSFYPKDNPNWYVETQKQMQQIINKEYTNEI